MNFIMTVFGYPFGWLMYGLYHLVSNYGVALVLFTLIVKLLLFPAEIHRKDADHPAQDPGDPGQVQE